MAFGYTRTLPTITGSHSDFSVLLVAGSFPTAAIDGGASSIINGGGNLRAYTDDTKVTRLSLEIATFVTGGSPDIQVWVKIPTAATGNTIFLEADSVATTQPAVGAAFGRNAVWSGYESVLHDGSTLDSTGNRSITVVNAPSIVTGKNGDASLYDGTNDNVYMDATGLDITGNLSISAWTKATSASSFNRIVHIRNTSGTAQITTNTGTAHYVFANGSGAATGTGIGRGGSGSAGVFELLQASQTSMSNRDLDIDTVNQTATSSSWTVGSNLNRIYIGARSDNASFFNGTLEEVRISEAVYSDDFKSTEFDNQDAPVSWGTSGTWADAGGGDISVTGATANYNYTGVDGSIDLTGEVIVTGNTANYNYSGIIGAVDLTALITVTGQTANYDYTGIAADVIIQGAIIVIGNTANYDYLGVNATISLQGPIVVNPRNIIQAKRNSTTIRVKRKSNTVIVKRNSNTIKVR